MKIGIFGGSFNPPHLMHKKLVIDLTQRNYVDQVIIVPTGDYYQKQELISFDKRYHMVKLMVGDMPQVKVSNFEEKGTLIYTYQTLDYFHHKYPDDEIYFILGSDNLKELSTWKKASEMILKYKFLIVLRNGDTKEDLTTYIPEDNHNFVFTDINLEDVCSTNIRKELKDSKNDFLEQWVDKKVLTFIEKEKIYSKR